MAKDHGYANESVPYISEFFARQRLSKLGFTSDFSELDINKAEAFLIIDSEVERLKSEMMKKKR